MTEYVFIEPVDVLYLRGNRLFGEAGDHAEPLMPPWPTLFAGALRSRMLVDAGADLHAFAAGRARAPGLETILGTPQEPGSFAIASVGLARRKGSDVEPLFPLPADLHREQETGRVRRLEPIPASDLAPVRTSSPLPCVPFLRSRAEGKGDRGDWMTADGLARYLRGEPVERGDLCPQDELWAVEPRLGIGMDPARRTAEEGLLYTTGAVALAEGVGFLVGVNGADGAVPKEGLVRLGGDGRGAVLHKVDLDDGPWKGAPSTERFRIVLATPGLFPEGWRLPGLEEAADGALRLEYGGVVARLVAAAVARPHVVSGWDLAGHRPKPAERAVPAGSVYWLECERGDPTALRPLVDEGLWPLMPGRGASSQRRAEGFNRIWLAPA